MAGLPHKRSTRRAKNLVSTKGSTLTKSKKSNIIITCPYCTAFVKGEIGLKVHISRKHENKKVLLCASQKYGKLGLNKLSSTFFSSSIIPKGQISSEEEEEEENEEEENKKSWFISKSRAIFAVSAVMDKFSSSPSLSSTPSSSKMFQKRNRDEDFHNLSNISTSTNSSVREINQDPIISCKHCFDQFYEDKYYKLHMQNWHTKDELQSGPSTEAQQSRASSETTTKKSYGNSCTTSNHNTRSNGQSSNARVNRLVISIASDGKPVVSTLSTAKEKAQKMCQPETEASESSSTNQSSISFNCTHCNYCAKSRPALMHHMTSIHKVRSSFPCSNCNFVGLQLIELIKHPCK